MPDKHQSQLIDQEAFRPLYVAHGDNDSLRLAVPDAHCSRCLNKIESSLIQLPGVQAARLDLGEKVLTVTGTVGMAFAPVLTTLQELGYEAQPLKIDSQAEQVRSLRRRGLLRLGVAAACSMNIMLLSVAQYSGAAESEFDFGFGWLSLALFLPVLLFSAQPFFRNVWLKAKVRRLSIDAPVIMALTVGTIYSLGNLLAGKGETYFDSLSALIFLLLAARAWQEHIQRRLGLRLEQLSFLEIFSTQRKNRVTGTYDRVPPEKLLAGDEIRLLAGERLPADVRLLSAKADFNMAIWTGEAAPQTLLAGQTVYAGSTVVSDWIDGEVIHAGPSSRLGHLLNRLRFERKNRGNFQTLVDRVGEYFTLIVVSVAGGYLVWNGFHDPIASLHRALALTLLACPCALAIAAPLALTRGLELAQRFGLVIKNGETLERLAQVRHVLFDKTGTLTSGNAEVVEMEPPQLPLPLAQAISSLEKDSTHPFGQAIVRHLKAPGTLPVVSRKEEAGKGVSGEVAGVNYRIARLDDARSASMSDWSVIGVWANNNLVARFAVVDPIRPEALATLRQIRQLGLETHLVSGDRKSVAEHVAATVGIDIDHVHAECQPEDKLRIGRELGHTMVVGDGVNDTLAMAAADVAVAVHGGMEASLKAADVYLARADLSGILNLIQLGEQVRKTIRRGLTVSIIYNTTGGALALMGYIHPLLAAILMPVSSITLVTITLLSLRAAKAER